MAYFEPAGAEHQTAHPHPEGDATTLFYFTPEALERLTGDVLLPTAPILPPGTIDLAHRRLVAEVQRGIDSFEGEERLVQLLGALLEAAAPGRVASRRHITAAAHERLADAAKEAIVDDPVNADLRSLADRVGYSPFHVSRTFRSVVGVTLTRFRNRVRTALAMERIGEGEPDLASLAADLGFFDQAHMTRVLNAEVGAPPGRLRQVL